MTFPRVTIVLTYESCARDQAVPGRPLFLGDSRVSSKRIAEKYQVLSCHHKSRERESSGNPESGARKMRDLQVRDGRLPSVGRTAREGERKSYSVQPIRDAARLRVP